jgi:hypothetical protein
VAELTGLIDKARRRTADTMAEAAAGVEKLRRILDVLPADHPKRPAADAALAAGTTEHPDRYTIEART